jgi:20S proteasome subunit beta 2
VVLGADTRATEGSIVCDKNCEKIHYIAPNIYCCGAGTSADTENTTRLISSQLELLRYATGAPSRVVTAMTMLKRRLFQYQGYISAALVLGGVDVTGPHLYSVYPHGSTDKLPFMSMGSGSLAAMSVLETGFKDELSEEEAIALVARAIRAGIFNDLGSGSNVDITVIRAAPKAEGAAAAASAGAAGASAGAAGGAAGKPQVSILRNYETPNQVEELRRRITRPAGRTIPRGATTVVKELFRKAVVVTEVPAAAAGGAGESKMDLDA